MADLAHPARIHCWLTICKIVPALKDRCIDEINADAKQVNGRTWDRTSVPRRTPFAA